MEKKPLSPLVLPPLSGVPRITPAYGGPIRKELYKTKPSKAIGIIQIVGGIVLFVFCLGAALPRMGEPMMAQIASAGFCSLIGLIICGGFAIAASKKKTPCLIITHMVFCVLLAITLFQLFALSIFAMASGSHRMSRFGGMGRHGYANDVVDPMSESSDPMDWPDKKGEDMPDMKMGDMKDRMMGDMKDGKRGHMRDGKMGHMKDRKMGHMKGRRGGEWDRSDMEDDDDMDAHMMKGHKLSLGCAGMVFVLSLMEFIVSIWGSALACKVTCCEKRGNPVSPTFMYQQPHVVELGGNADVRTKSALTKEQEAFGGMQGLDARELDKPASPPPAYNI